MGRDKKEKGLKKSKHKHKHKKEKKKQKKSKRKHKEEKPKTSPTKPESNDEGEGFEIPIELMNTKSHAPESKEEYERRQSKIRHEKDPVTGRIRLIKGDSEVLEEIVSRDRSRKINKEATHGDGEYFQTQTIGKRRN